MKTRFLSPMAWLFACVSVFFTPAHAELYGDLHGFPGQGVVLLIGFQNDPPYVGERARFAFAPFVDVIFDDKGEWVDGGRFVSQGDNKPGDPNTFPDDRVLIRGSIELLDNKGRVIQRDRFPQQFTQPFVTGDYITEFTPRTGGRYALVLSGRFKAKVQSGEIIDFKFANERFVCKPVEKLHVYIGDGIPCLRERTRPVPYAPLSPE